MSYYSIKSFLKNKYPSFLNLVFRLRDHLIRKVAVKQAFRFQQASSNISISYLASKFPHRPPTRAEVSHGGLVKMTYLAEAFPHCFPVANVLYTVSSVDHPARLEIIKSARQKGIKVVLNQNGVAYPAWHGVGWEKTNERMKVVLSLAHYVIYQSDFCRRSADHFLIPPLAGWEILFNPVETNLFRPMFSSRNEQAITLVLGGNQYERYRFDLAIEGLEKLSRVHPNTHLIVTGKLWDTSPETRKSVHAILEHKGLLDKVEFIGSYTQQDAPYILNKGQILLHTKFNDPCPTIVIEALSCGLPVVYLDSGGTPELVAEAGIGVPVQASWKKNEFPTPDLLSNAVLTIMDRYKVYSEAARQRAVEVFAVEKYIQAHRRVFEKLLDTK